MGIQSYYYLLFTRAHVLTRTNIQFHWAKPLLYQDTIHTILSDLFGAFCHPIFMGHYCRRAATHGVLVWSCSPWRNTVAAVGKTFWKLEFPLIDVFFSLLKSIPSLFWKVWDKIKHLWMIYFISILNDVTFNFISRKKSHLSLFQALVLSSVLAHQASMPERGDFLYSKTLCKIAFLTPRL